MPFSKCVRAASHLVGHFHHSPMATNELLKEQRSVKPDVEPKKVIQYVKTRWNSVVQMFDRLNELRWPIVAVLSDRSITKLTDAKTLDMKDEYWDLMAEVTPVLKPLRSQPPSYPVKRHHQHHLSTQCCGDWSTCI